MKLSEKTTLFCLQLLGTPSLIWQEENFTLSRRQARALLFRLAAGPPATRDDLCLLLWPDAADAVTRRNLTRLLSYTRQTLPHPDLLSVNQTATFLNPDLVSVDVAQFWQLCAQDDAAALETAVSLVRAPFLAGFSLPGSCEFDFWHTRTQQQIEQQYLAALSRLFEALTQVFTGLAQAISLETLGDLPNRPTIFHSLRLANLPLLLCLDDAHWADEATLGWLHFAANRLAGSGVCILATYRVHEAAPLQAWQGTLRRTNLSAVISLAGLTVTDVAAILRQVDEAADSYEALDVRIHRATGGNIFLSWRRCGNCWKRVSYPAI